MLEERQSGCIAGAAGHLHQDHIQTRLVGKVTAQSLVETDSGLDSEELLDA